MLNGLIPLCFSLKAGQDTSPEQTLGVSEWQAKNGSSNLELTV
jgi:hypothetical protein